MKESLRVRAASMTAEEENELCEEKPCGCDGQCAAVSNQ